MTDDVMHMWVVYFDPHDFPGEVVARKWEVRAGQTRSLYNLIRVQVGGDVSGWSSEQLREAQLKAVREAVQSEMPGAVMMQRSPEDDAAIVESWV